MTRPQKKRDWLKIIYLWWYKYFPRFTTGLYLYTPPTRNNPPNWQFILPGNDVTLRKDQYLVEVEFLNLFGLHFCAKFICKYHL